MMHSVKGKSDQNCSQKKAVPVEIGHCQVRPILTRDTTVRRFSLRSMEPKDNSVEVRITDT